MTSRNRAAWSALLCWCVLGCGNSPPTPTAPADGKSLLQRALDSWKNGDTVAGLASAASPLVVAEPRWEAGWKLKEFDLTSDASDGFQARCVAVLSLVDPTGKASREKAEYIVTTAPKQTVSRTSEGW